MNKSYEAMMFARKVHANQKRKFTGLPYTGHLAEVAGIAMSIGWHTIEIHPDNFMAVCWLHDCIEDCNVEFSELQDKFNLQIAIGVLELSDIEIGNRVERKLASRKRLSKSPAWVQTIKVADVISNTSSIALHNDPKFVIMYLKEKQLLLEVLTKANPKLLDAAKKQIEEIFINYTNC